MKKWTVGKRIVIGFAAILLILTTLGVWTRFRLSVINTEAQSITNSVAPLESAAEMMEGLKENVTLVYKHIYSAKLEEKVLLESQMKTNAEKNTKLLETFDNSACSLEATELAAKIKTLREAARKARTEILNASKSATNAEASAKLSLRAQTEFDPLIVSYSEEMDKLWEVEKKEMQASCNAIVSKTRNAKLLMLFALGFALLLGIGLALIITRSINRVLRRVSSSLSAGSQQVVAAAGQVSSASQSLAEGASEQAASLEETSSSLEEMASMTKRNAEGAQMANDLARQARTSAEAGTTDMQAMIAAMEAIKASGNKISKIIKTIDEIAFQTNILALNAAVEAARAGEAGMGFAVVADEVRNLAQRSAQAAKETSSMIEEAINNTTQGVKLSSKVAESLQEIMVKARKVDELAGEVATSSKEQNQGIEQINTAVSQMDKVTQTNAANAEESASAAEELNAQAETLREATSELLAMIDSNHVSVLSSNRNHHEPEAHRDGHKLGSIARSSRSVPNSLNRHYTASTANSNDDFVSNKRKSLSHQDTAASVSVKNLIEWDAAAMSTGVDAIDAEHRELFGMVNQLHHACREGFGCDEMLKMLNFLGEYVKNHFRHEEEEMEARHCPSRYDNKTAHRQFLHDFEAIIETVKHQGATTSILLQLKTMVRDWLQNHICSIDTHLRECVSTRKSDNNITCPKYGHGPNGSSRLF